MNLKLISLQDLPPQIRKGEVYVGSPTPTPYDPNTLMPSDPSYIVTGDDGKCRRYYAKYFLTVEEWRETQLDKLLK